MSLNTDKNTFCGFWKVALRVAVGCGVFFQIAFTVNPGQAAEAVCNNVQNSAVTYYPSSDTASVTEQDRDCRISIGGANAGSSLPSNVSNIVICSGRIISERQLTQPEALFFAENLIPVIAGLSAEGFSLSNFVTPHQVTQSGCIQWWDSIIYADHPLFISNLAGYLDQDVIARCLHNQNGSSSDAVCQVTEDQIVIRMRSNLGNHTVFLPASGLNH